MTVINAHVTDSRVLLCTDSEVVSPDGSMRGEQSKVLYLPHANIAMAGRGVQMLTLGLFQGAWLNLISNLDQLEDTWTNEALNAFRLQLLAQAQNEGVVFGEVPGAEILIAGFSHRRDRMTALHFVAPSGGKFIKVVRDSGVISPECDLRENPAMDTVDAMAAIARHQVASWKARAPSQGFGGRLVFADMNRHGTSFSTMVL
jgi:hypothetical protein